MFLLFLAPCVFACNFWPFCANFKQDWQRAGGFQRVNMLQARSHSRRLGWKPSRGGCGWEYGLQRCCPLSAPASPEPLSHSFAALRCLDTIWEVYMSFEAQIVFPHRPTQREGRFTCHLQKPAVCSSVLHVGQGPTAVTVA